MTVELRRVAIILKSEENKATQFDWSHAPLLFRFHLEATGQHTAPQLARTTCGACSIFRKPLQICPKNQSIAIKLKYDWFHHKTILFPAIKFLLFAFFRNKTWATLSEHIPWVATHSKCRHFLIGHTSWVAIHPKWLQIPSGDTSKVTTHLNCRHTQTGDRP